MAAHLHPYKIRRDGTLIAPLGTVLEYSAGPTLTLNIRDFHFASNSSSLKITTDFIE